MFCFAFILLWRKIYYAVLLTVIMKKMIICQCACGISQLHAQQL